MQAILTKVLPATNTKPTRIKASCARGSYVISADGNEAGHVAAAQALCDTFLYAGLRRGESMAVNPWNRQRITGQLPNGNYCHVFLS